MSQTTHHPIEHDDLAESSSWRLVAAPLSSNGKRAYDFAAALILLAPLSIGMARWIKRLGPGAIFDCSRVAQNGRATHWPGFRTTRGNGDAIFAWDLLGKATGRRGSQDTRKLEERPRAARARGTLRRAITDPLLQMANLLITKAYQRGSVRERQRC